MLGFVLVDGEIALKLSKQPKQKLKENCSHLSPKQIEQTRQQAKAPEMRVDLDNSRLIIPSELAELNQKITVEQKDTFIACL